MTSASESDTPDRSGLELSRTLTFFFEDPNWVPKLLVGSLFALLAPLLVGPVFVVGYGILVAKRTMAGESAPLPEWDDLGGIFLDGLKGMAISLAHKIPLLFLGVILFLAVFGSVFLHGEGSALPEEMLFFGLPVLFGGFLLVFVLALAILLYLPAAFVSFVKTGSLGTAFDVTRNIAFIRDHQSSYLMGIVAIGVATFIAQFGILLFCIGIFPATFWSACVIGYVVGELARLDDGPTLQEASE